LTAGQRHDAPLFPEVLGAALEVSDFECVVGDKAYDSDAIREDLFARDLVAVIPSKANRKESVPLEPELYRKRNRVERLVGKVKQFRRLATRYDKLATTFLGFVQLVATFVMIR
jgi:transposase